MDSKVPATNKTDTPPESRGHKIMKYVFWPILIVFLIIMFVIIIDWYGGFLIFLPLAIALSGIPYLIMRRISIRDQVDGFKYEPMSEK